MFSRLSNTVPNTICTCKPTKKRFEANLNDVTAETVQSFDQYRAFIRQALSRLTPFGVFSFCVWCLERFEPELGEVIFEGCTPAERAQATEMIEELHDFVARAAIMSSTRASELKAELDLFGPQGDEVYEEDAPEFEPEALEFLSALEHTLLYCQHQDVAAACMVSETWVDCRDYHAEQNDVPYSLETMFTHPDLKQELELQVEQMVKLEG